MSFDKFFNAPEAYLYHGSSVPIPYNLLLPRPNRTVAGESGNFVFATNHPVSAVAYAMKTDDMASCNVEKDSQGREITFVTIVNRAKFLNSPPSGRIFRILPAKFSNVLAEDGADSAEWISQEPIKIGARDVISVPGIKTVMDFGVQVFFARDGVEKPKVIDFLLDRKPDFNALKHSELFTWENARSENQPGAGANGAIQINTLAQSVNRASQSGSRPVL